MPNAMDKRLTDKIVRYFATQPIVKAWVFGSYARGEAHSGSDIDILVVFDKEAKVSLMRHAKISLELSELLGFDVDLITEGTLLSFAERTANNDKILIYERASREISRRNGIRNRKPRMSLRNQTFGFSFLWAIFYSEKRGYLGLLLFSTCLKKEVLEGNEPRKFDIF